MKKQKITTTDKRKIKDIAAKKDVRGGDKKKDDDKQDYMLIKIQNPTISSY